MIRAIRKLMPWNWYNLTPRDRLFILALYGVALCGLALVKTADPAYLIAGILCLILARLAI